MTPAAMRDAASRGDLEALKKFYWELRYPYGIREASKNSQVETLSWLLERAKEIEVFNNYEVQKELAAFEDPSVLVWILDNVKINHTLIQRIGELTSKNWEFADLLTQRHPSKDSPEKASFVQGFLESKPTIPVCEILLQKYKIITTKHLVYGAAKHGRLDILDWLVRNGVDMKTAPSHAADSDYETEVVKYLVEKKMYTPQSYKARMYKFATVLYLFSKGFPVSTDYYSWFGEASENATAYHWFVERRMVINEHIVGSLCYNEENLPILEDIAKRYPDSLSADIYIQSTPLKVMKWLHSKGFKPSIELLRNAEHFPERAHVHKWIYENAHDK